MMRRPQHIHHLFFPSKPGINPRGIIRWGATEVSIYHAEKEALEIPDVIDQHTSVHDVPLEPSLINMIETVQEDVEDMIVEESLVCVNLDDCNSSIAYTALLTLYQNRLAFQGSSRPSLGPYATVLYYQTNGELLSPIPLIPAQPELCSVIYRILARQGKSMDKEEIKNVVHNVQPTITKDKIDNALIILENWLALYPGFTAEQKNRRSRRSSRTEEAAQEVAAEEAEQKKQRRKEYQIKEFV